MNDDDRGAGTTDAPEEFLSAAWRRVKEHRIAQWTVGYVAVAYGIQHALTLTSEAFKWPDAVIRISMLLLILGLPLAMTFAWYHGERASRRMATGETAIVSLLLVLISFAFYVTVRTAPQIATHLPQTREAGVTAARQASLSPNTGISLAVLPFDNLSPDPNQGYFVDGMGDEIITALAKIPDLRVIGRESALEFKGKHPNFRDVGKALNATHLLEGSVRKAGDQLRISAELVRADTGVTVWANSYDRELKDVFVVQEDIARSIAGSLHMTLGLKPGEDLVNQRTQSAALHDDYLRGRNLVRTDQLDDAIKLLNDFVMREPAYAPAWAELAVAHNEKLIANPNLVAGTVAEALPVIREEIAKRDAAADQALKLDAGNAQANCITAESRRDRHDLIAAMELWQRAIALDPDEPDCLEAYGLQLVRIGFPDKGLEVMDHLVAVEPLSPDFRGTHAAAQFYAGQNETVLKFFSQRRPGNLLAMTYAALGQLQRAADTLAAARPPNENPAITKAKSEATRLLHAAPAPAPRDAPELGFFDWVYVFTGAPERFMGTFEDHLRAGTLGSAYNGPQWAPAFASALKTDRFKAWTRASGILAYWRAKGWPARCHATTGDDFECN